jgi:hypothetical protein
MRSGAAADEHRLASTTSSRQVVTRSGGVASVEVMSYALCWQRSCVACQESVAAGGVASVEVMSYALCWQRSCVACQESVAAGRVAGL